jgi:hypothetical protein
LRRIVFACAFSKTRAFTNQRQCGSQFAFAPAQFEASASYRAALVLHNEFDRAPSQAGATVELRTQQPPVSFTILVKLLPILVIAVATNYVPIT